MRLVTVILALELSVPFAISSCKKQPPASAVKADDPAALSCTNDDLLCPVLNAIAADDAAIVASDHISPTATTDPASGDLGLDDVMPQTSPVNVSSALDAIQTQLAQLQAAAPTTSSSARADLQLQCGKIKDYLTSVDVTDPAVQDRVTRLLAALDKTQTVLAAEAGTPATAGPAFDPATDVVNRAYKAFLAAKPAPPVSAVFTAFSGANDPSMAFTCVGANAAKNGDLYTDPKSKPTPAALTAFGSPASFTLSLDDSVASDGSALSVVVQSQLASRTEGPLKFDPNISKNSLCFRRLLASDGVFQTYPPTYSHYRETNMVRRTSQGAWVIVIAGSQFYSTTKTVDDRPLDPNKEITAVRMCWQAAAVR